MFLKDKENNLLKPKQRLFNQEIYLGKKRAKAIYISKL